MNAVKNFEEPQIFENKLIYVFSIDDTAHKGLLKIGDTTIDSKISIDQLSPNSKFLNEAAKKRIDSYTSTAGIKYKLEYTELAIKQIKTKNGSIQLKSFRDHDVHRVLLNSRIKQVKISETAGKEWFKVDLETVIKAIQAVKTNTLNLIGSKVDSYIPIVFRPEQDEAINKTLKQFKLGKYMLWNAKMRFGKTITALEVIKRGKFKKNIIITHRPVVDQGWREDFDKIFHKDDGYKYGSKKDIPDDKNISKLGSKFVYFASMQDLRGSSIVGGKFNKNSAIFDVEWDLVIVDEAHEGTTTALGDEVIKNILKENTCPKTKFLALSGTPFNIISKYDDKSVYTWDYMMEQKAKEEWPLKHFGDSNPYVDLPKLHIYTYDLGKLLKSSAYIELVDKAFNFTEFFRVRRKGALNDTVDVSSTDDLEFCHKDDVKSFLNLITKTDANSFYPYSNDKLRNLFKHTLWVVPGVKEAKALKELMLLHPVFGSGKFNIVNVAGNGDEEIDNALEAVKDAIAKSKDEEYTITLTCGKLTTGVTIPEWTAVFMLAGSYSTSASSYLQTIFRVQSPCNKDGKIKTNCFVFDFAPDRTLKMVADSISLSKRAGKTTDSDRTRLGEFLNYCSVISIDGTRMKEYSTDNLLQQLKKVYADRAVRTGFDDSSIYSDELYKLTKDDLSDFKELKGIIGSTPANSNTSDIDINNQGFTDEEYEKNEANKRKKKAELTDVEKEELKRYEEIKENRRKAISILRGISVRMPLLIYGANINLNDDFKIEDFLNDDLVDEESWREFMPKDVTRALFKRFIKYYDKDVFVAAGKRIRNIVKYADSLEPIERVKTITSIFSYFKNPDKETVLTPWRVVNMHMGDCLGGYVFFNEKYDNSIDEPRYLKKKNISDDLFSNNDVKILEINAKTGVYPLYLTYSIYQEKIKNKKELNLYEKERLWINIIEDNIFVLCKTPMAKQIVQRTLIGYKNVPTNIIYIENLIGLIKTNIISVTDYLLSGSSWNKKKQTMKFDAIVGNPPYQINDGGGMGSSALPVYDKFVILGLSLNPNYLSMIIPSRWFSGGRGLDSFRQIMLHDDRIRELYDFWKSNNLFPNVEIKGGVCYFLWDKSYKGNCKIVSYQDLYEKTISERPLLEPGLNFFIRNNKIISILRKVQNKKQKSFANLISSNDPFGFDVREKNSYKRVKPNFSLYKKDNNQLLMYYNGWRKNGIGYVDISNIKKGQKLVTAKKILIPKAWGVGNPNTDKLSFIVPDKPSVCTETYLVVGPFEDQQTLLNVLSYMKTKFFHLMVSLMKISQNTMKGAYTFVPMQDFSKEWTDSLLYQFYDFSTDEIDFINDYIKL